MMMDSEEEEEQTALVCDNGKFRDSNSGYPGKIMKFCKACVILSLHIFFGNSCFAFW